MSLINAKYPDLENINPPTKDSFSFENMILATPKSDPREYEGLLLSLCLDGHNTDFKINHPMFGGDFKMLEEPFMFLPADRLDKVQRKNYRNLMINIQRFFSDVVEGKNFTDKPKLKGYINTYDDDKQLYLKSTRNNKSARNFNVYLREKFKIDESIKHEPPITTYDHLVRGLLEGARKHTDGYIRNIYMYNIEGNIITKFLYCIFMCEVEAMKEGQTPGPLISELQRISLFRDKFVITLMCYRPAELYEIVKRSLLPEDNPESLPNVLKLKWIAPKSINHDYTITFAFDNLGESSIPKLKEIIDKYVPILRSAVADDKTFTSRMFFPEMNVYTGSMKNMLMLFAKGDFIHISDEDDIILRLTDIISVIENNIQHFNFAQNIFFAPNNYLMSTPLWDQIIYPINAIRFRFNMGYGLIDGEDLVPFHNHDPRYTFQSHFSIDSEDLWHDEKGFFKRNGYMHVPYDKIACPMFRTIYKWKGDSSEFKERSQDNVKIFAIRTIDRWRRFINPTFYLADVRPDDYIDAHFNSPILTKYDTQPTYEDASDDEDEFPTFKNRTLNYFHPDVSVIVRFDENNIVDDLNTLRQRTCIPITHNYYQRYFDVHPDDGGKVIVPKGYYDNPDKFLLNTFNDTVKLTVEDKRFVTSFKERTDGDYEISLREWNDYLLNHALIWKIFGGEDKDKDKGGQKISAGTIWLIVGAVLMVVTIVVILVFFPSKGLDEKNNNQVNLPKTYVSIPGTAGMIPIY